IVMPLELWREVCKQVSQSTIDRLVCESRSNPEPDLTAIRAELEKRVPCPKCEGVGVIERRVADADKVDDPCPLCDKTGTIPNGVPGCRLKPRGESLDRKSTRLNSSH